MSSAPERPGWRWTCPPSGSAGSSNPFGLDPRLPKILSGETSACRRRRTCRAGLIVSGVRQFYAWPTRFFREAFADTARADRQHDYLPPLQRRLCRGLAGCGRARMPQLRGRKNGPPWAQALAWLRADLTALAERLAEQPDAEGAPGAAKDALLSVKRGFRRGSRRRGPCPVARGRAQKWQQFWADFAATLAQA